MAATLWLIYHIYKFVVGPRGRCTTAFCRSHGSSRLPESDENQHVFMGKDSQAKLQAQEISYQAPS